MANSKPVVSSAFTHIDACGLLYAISFDGALNISAHPSNLQGGFEACFKEDCSIFNGRKIITSPKILYDILYDGLCMKKDLVDVKKNYIAPLLIITVTVDVVYAKERIALEIPPKLNVEGAPHNHPVAVPENSVLELQKINKRLDALGDNTDMLKEIKDSMSKLTAQIEQLLIGTNKNTSIPIPELDGSDVVFRTQSGDLIMSGRKTINLSFDVINGAVDILLGEKYRKVVEFRFSEIEKFTNLTEFVIYCAPILDVQFLRKNKNLKSLKIIRKYDFSATTLSLASIVNNTDIEQIEVIGNYAVTDIGCLNQCKKLKKITLPRNTYVGEIITNPQFEITMV